jgi:biotin transport system substrate-specific component
MFERQIKAGPAWASIAAFFVALALLMIFSPMKWTTTEGVPITLQSLLVVLIPAILGWKWGTAAVLIYLLAGGIGAPVFAYGTSGWDRFTGSTAGFLLAFPLAAMLSGWAMEMRTRSKMIIAVLILFSGQLLILALGLLWQRAIIPIEETVEATLIRLGPGLLIKTALGSLVLVILSRVVAALTKVKHSTTPDAD